ncbi:hypothetical protein Tco_0623017 [Tanacetum coccineum]
MPWTRNVLKLRGNTLLIEHENLIVDCLSNELLYSVINYVNIVSRFSEMHDAYTVEQAHNIELKYAISNLKHKIQKDDHSEMIKHFSKLEVDHLNLQLKYQHLKERFGNKNQIDILDTPAFDSFFKINKLKEQLQGKDITIRKLKVQISHMNERRSEVDRILDFKALYSQNIELTENVTAHQEYNEHLKAENKKVKHHYKELYDSIKITHAKTIEKTSSLLTENEKLKTQVKGKMECVNMNTVKPKVLAPGMYAIDVEPIPPRNRNNREVHLDYLKHLKKSVETLREIVEEARIERPLDNALENACFYTKRSQELLEYVIGTCPKEFSKRDKKVATTPLTRNKQVTFRETCETSNNNTQTHVEKQNVKKTNVPVIPSTGVNSSTEASASKPRSNTKNNRILPAKSDNNKKVEDHLRNNKSNLKQENWVDSSISSKRTFIGIIKFGNDHFGAIMGYEDYVISDSVISRVYYVEGLGHNLFSVGQFCDSDLEVSFKKHSCYVRDEDGVDLLKVQVPIFSANTPSSTSIDQDSPSTSHSPSSLEVQAPILHQGVADGPTFEDNPFAQVDNDPFVNPFAPEPSSEESSSGDVSTTVSN